MDTMQSLLMSAIASGSSRDVLMQQLLQQADLDEPTMGLLSKYLAERNVAEQDDPTDTDDEEATQDQIYRLTELLEDTSNKLQRVYAEVEELRSLKQELSTQLIDLEERYGRLIDALGICHECLGSDRNCPVCGGQGYPGSGFYQIDDELFEDYIVPVVRAKIRSFRFNQAHPN